MTDLTPVSIHGPDHEQRMLDWHGLRPSKAARCLRVVQGKRCILGNGWNDHCLCRMQSSYNLFDHVGIWLDAEGRHVLTSEPYNSNPQRIEDLTAQMADLGITVTVGDPSPWYPGHTTLLMFTAS
jgi:hypothetical protein